MKDNVYRFRSLKHGDPEKLKMIPEKPKARLGWFLAAIAAGCAIISFVAFLYLGGRFTLPV